MSDFSEKKELLAQVLERGASELRAKKTTPHIEKHLKELFEELESLT